MELTDTIAVDAIKVGAAVETTKVAATNFLSISFFKDILNLSNC